MKSNNNRYTFGDDGFEITNGTEFEDRYLKVSHDGSDAVSEIGKGSDKTEYALPLTLGDEGYFDLPPNTAGHAFLLIGDAEYYFEFDWDRFNHVNLIDGTASYTFAGTDPDGSINAFDNGEFVRVKNRLGSAKKVLAELHYTDAPVAPTFQVFNVLSGVDNLDPFLTINGTTVTPTFRYKGGDAVYEQLSIWEYGTNIYGASSALLNQGSPGLGVNDDSVIPNGYWASLSSLYADVATEDLVFEFVLKWTTTDGAGLLGKMDRTYHASGGEGGGPYYSYNGYGILESSDTVSFLVCAGGLWDDAVVSSAALTNECWYHLLIFLDRSGSGQWYVNGVASGSAVDISSEAATLTNTEEIRIGTLPYLALAYYNSNLAYAAMWKEDDWLDTHLQADVAAERFAKFAGFYPQIADGTYLPTTAEREYPAYLDKREGIYRKLFYVGNNWMRMCRRQDLSGETVSGYLPETAAENLIPESEDFSTWTKYDAGDAIVDDTVVCPDGRTKAGSIAADSTSGAHFIYTTATLTVATYTFSCFIKPGNKTWVVLRASSIANGICYFDVANGVVGTSEAAVTGYIEGPFYSGDATPFYRCCIVFTGTAAPNGLSIYVADADNDYTISDGNGSTVNLYFWGAQLELGDYMTSPIRTSGSALERVKDELQYVAGANIGGEDIKHGSMYADILFPDYDNTSSAAISDLSDGGASTDRILFQTTSADIIGAISAASGGSAGGVDATGDVYDNIKHTVALLYETDNMHVSKDGTAGTADTFCDMPDNLDVLDVGQDRSAALQTKGLIQNFRCIPTVEPYPTFRAFSRLSGVDNLTPSLTINGTTVTPKFRYKLGDANATNLVPWTYGETLTRVAVSTPPTYNDGSPGLGPNDDSCRFNGSDYYKNATAVNQFTTGDIVFEIVWKATDALEYLCSSYVTNGFVCYGNALGTGNIEFLINDDDGSSTVVSAASSSPAGTWNYAIVFVNRDEASTSPAYGSQWYINGIASGSGVDMSAQEKTLTSTVFTVGAKQDSTTNFNSNIAYIAAWEYADWHQAGAAGPAEWANIAKIRFAKFAGFYPQIFNNGSNVLVDGDMEAVGTTAWTADDCTLSKDTTVPLYEGAQHLRITSTGATFYAKQSPLVAGHKYRITGAARTVSGSAVPRVIAGGHYPWVGIDSASWQEFDVEVVALESHFYIGSSDASGVVDFDNVVVTRADGLPTTATRAYPAYIDKVESGVRKLYYVGDHWLRMCHRQDVFVEDVYGYLPETAATNLIPESEDFSTWSLIEAGTVVVDDVAICPDGRTKAASIAGDSDDEQHGITKNPVTTAVTHTLSVFAKPGAQTWLRVQDASVASCYCDFDIANGIKGSVLPGCVGYIEGPFYNGFYRCCIVYTASAGSSTIRLQPIASDGDSTFSGDGSTPDIYIWGAQLEIGDYMTSPIITDAGSAQRVKDNLQFVAGDNIGGEDVGQGSIYADVLFSDYESATYRGITTLSDGEDTSDRVALLVNQTSGYGRALTAASGGSAGSSVGDTDIADGAKHVCQATWQDNNTFFSLDGVPDPTPDISCDMPDDLDTLEVGSLEGATLQTNGLIQDLRIYDKPTLKG